MDNCLTRHHWANPKIQNLDVIRTICPKDVDLKPGCGGIRKHVEHFTQQGFIELFITAIMLRKRNSLKESTWIIGGDGRYYFKETFYRVVSVLAGYKVGNIVTAKDGIITSPAMCYMVQKLKALGGILIAASHMPAGPDGYIGIKYVVEDGSAASDSVLKDIYNITKKINFYNYTVGVDFSLNELTSYNFGIEDHILSVTIYDFVRIYADYLKTIFDYEKIRNFLTGDEIVSIPVRIIVDCMHGAAGPYAREVIEYDLGAAPGSVINAEPKKCYRTGYPSPRNSMGLVQGLRRGRQEVGFALDVGGAMVMVMGKRAYQVSSSDSVAVVAGYLHCIPYFQRLGISGYARNMTTSQALDKVVKTKSKPIYVVPIGWVYFRNLIKEKKISFCGDSCYGLGSSHLSESDGLWGVLAWLSVLHHMRLSVHELMHHHWLRHGRCFLSRLVFENIEDEKFSSLVDYMEFLVSNKLFPSSRHGTEPFVYTVMSAEYLKYKDPIDQIIHTSGVLINLHPTSRIIYRAGIGSVNRLRIYLEGYSDDPSYFNADPSTFLTPLMKVAVTLVNIPYFLGGMKPTYML